MRGVRAPCPACGGPVIFKISSSLVTVCPQCNSVVARGDRKLEDLGKVAAIVETNSPLQLGLKGKFQGKSFELVGRAQYAHSAGGSWDEWYAAFSNGKWGWLAEAQGRFYITFQRKVSDPNQLPELDELQAGHSFNFEGVGELTVGEVGVALTRAAAGEIPYRFEPNAEHRFADLYGGQGAFATFDYSDAEPNVYVGQEVTLDDLGIAANVVSDAEPREIKAIKVSCPQCGGPLTLHAPDETQRVCCPNCAAMLDANKGDLQYLRSLDVGKVKPLIPIGAVGTLFGVEYTLIGLLRRSVTEDGTDYFWSEYLLYNPREGFRWLVYNDGHWSFVRPVSPGDVRVSGQNASYKGRTFKLFQEGIARVRYVIGECYWKVEIGEEAATRDFIAPPDMLSQERSTTPAPPRSVESLPMGRSGVPDVTEVNVSLGTYIQREDVEQAFGVKNLPTSWKVAPNQPYPVDSRIYAWWGVFAVALLLLNGLFSSGILKQKADQFYFFVCLILLSVIPAGALIYRFFWESSRWEDSPYSPYVSYSSDDD